MEQKQIIVVVAVIRNNKGEILLARRNQPDIPEIHNIWEFVGGGVDFGEDPETAIIREVKEEAGVVVKVKGVIPAISNAVVKRGNSLYQLFLITYECEIIEGEIGKSHDQEIAELKFIPLADVKNYNAFENVKEIAEILSNI